MGVGIGLGVLVVSVAGEAINKGHDTPSHAMPALKKKNKQSDDEDTVELDVSESFDVAASKDSDFDLDLDCASYQSASGQAGTRTKD